MKSLRVVLVCFVSWCATAGWVLAEPEKQGSVAAQQSTPPLLANVGATPEVLPMSGLSFDPRKTSWTCALMVAQGYTLSGVRQGGEPIVQGATRPVGEALDVSLIDGRLWTKTPNDTTSKPHLILDLKSDVLVAALHWEDAVRGAHTITLDLGSGLLYRTNVMFSASSRTVISSTDIYVCQ